MSSLAMDSARSCWQWFQSTPRLYFELLGRHCHLIFVIMLSVCFQSFFFMYSILCVHVKSGDSILGYHKQLPHHSHLFLFSVSIIFTCEVFTVFFANCICSFFIKILYQNITYTFCFFWSQHLSL